MAETGLTTRVLQEFTQPLVSPARWHALLASGSTNSVFMTWHWQKAWWDVFGRGQLMLILVERNGQPITLAPLFADSGMVYFVGSGGSDYLDFVGDSSDSAVLMAILDAARGFVDHFLGFLFYHVPDISPTGAALQVAGRALGLHCYDQGDHPAPRLELAANQEAARTAARKKSLVRHENALRRRGDLVICHLRQGAEILPHLDAFFAQHITRWQATPFPSLFHEPAQRQFYQTLCTQAADTGWLRFTRLDWDGHPIAFHFGSCYDGSYLWYKPSFDVELARHSPGEVLLRQLMLAAMDEGAETFDFGLGDETFKQRFATSTWRVRNWGLYPAG